MVPQREGMGSWQGLFCWLNPAKPVFPMWRANYDWNPLELGAECCRAGTAQMATCTYYFKPLSLTMDDPNYNKLKSRAVYVKQTGGWIYMYFYIYDWVYKLLFYIKICVQKWKHRIVSRGILVWRDVGNSRHPHCLQHIRHNQTSVSFIRELSKYKVSSLRKAFPSSSGSILGCIVCRHLQKGAFTRFSSFISSCNNDLFKYI